VKPQPNTLNNAVHEIHVVSQVLLRRFIDPATRMLTGYHLASRRDYSKSPKSVGWVDEFIKHEPKIHEDYWKAEVEDHLHDAFQAVDDRSIFARPRQIQVLKDCIALHWARSKSYREIHDKILEFITSRDKEEWNKHRRDLLAIAFYHKYSLYAAGPEALAHINDELHEPLDSVVNGSWFATSLRENFDAARQRVQREHLEIAEPPAGQQFLIGDAPVLSFYRHGTTGPLPFFRAPLNEAGMVLLPIGPRHIACLGPAEKWIALDANAVEEMNKVQVLATKDWVMCHPSSGLTTFIERVVTSPPAGMRSHENN
jgi:hypothetical protein